MALISVSPFFTLIVSLGNPLVGALSVAVTFITIVSFEYIPNVRKLRILTIEFSSFLLNSTFVTSGAVLST